MKLKLTDHDWQHTKRTVWVCKRCGCARKSRNQPPADMLISMTGRGPRPHQKIFVHGPAYNKGETGVSCADIRVRQVMEA